MAKKKSSRSSKSARVTPLGGGGGGGGIWYMYLYQVISVPQGCTTYLLGDILRIALQENPPPATITLGGTGPCAGTVLQYYGEP